MTPEQTKLPEIFLERLSKIISGEPSFLEALHSFSVQKPLSIRINTLKKIVQEVEREFKEEDLLVDKVPWYKDAYIIKNKTAREVTELQIYREGGIYIQSLSSMIPSLILEPNKNDIVLDMAAAPGSKTTQIAALMQNNGTIVANDTDSKRLFKLKANLLHQGATNVTTSHLSGEMVWKKYPEYFDRVLLDAPCSMEGRFFTGELKSFDHWSVKKIKNLARLQRWLLRSAVSSTKEGGVIVYSTCTLAPEENEEVVDWLLEKEKGRVVLDTIYLPGLDLNDGFTSWEGKRYSNELKKTKRVLPNFLMEGFYIAKIKKVKSNVYREF